MKAIVKTRREVGIEVLDVETPTVGESDVLVKVAAGSLCGSDVHVYEWTPGYEWMPLPLTLGHEFAGEVVEVGSRVQNVAVGDRITALPLMSCSRCAMCQVGKGESCAAKTVLGLTADGAFAEYVRLTAAADIYTLPPEVSYDAASLCEPLSVALNAVELSKLKPGQTAAVLGPGPIGLLTLQVLRAAGASLVMVAGTGADRKRLEVAERLGADVIVDVEEEDAVNRAMAPRRARFDLVFEATGDPRSVSQALGMVRAGGVVVLIGIHPGPAEFNPTELVRQSKSIIGAYAYTAETWKRTLALLAAGRLDVEPMITHRLPLSEAREGFELAVRKEAAKVLFIP